MAENDLRKGVAKFISDIKKGLDLTTKDKISEVAARVGAQLIQRRTREGLGVATDGGTTYALKKLSKSYIEFRKRSSLSSHTTPTKSNLTFSGLMLGSLTAKRVERGRWQITMNGSNRNGLTNSQVARYVLKTRPFMHLSGGEIAIIKSAARKKFQELVKTKF